MYRDPELTFDPFNLTLPGGLPLPASKSWVETLSWTPRAYVYHNFITDAEVGGTNSPTPAPLTPAQL